MEEEEVNVSADEVQKQGVLLSEEEEHILSNMEQEDNVSLSVDQENNTLTDLVQENNVTANLGLQNSISCNVGVDSILPNNVLTNEKEINGTSNVLAEKEEYVGHFLSKEGSCYQEKRCFLCNRIFKRQEVPFVVDENGIVELTRACVKRNMKPYDITVGQLVHRQCRSRLLKVNNLRNSGPPNFSSKYRKKPRQKSNLCNRSKRKRKKWATSAVTVKQEIDTDPLSFNGNDTMEPPVFVAVKEEPEDVNMYDCETENTICIKQEPLYNQAEDSDKEDPLPLSSDPFESLIKTENIYGYSDDTNGSNSFTNSCKSVEVSYSRENSQEGLFRSYSSFIPGPGDNTEGWTLLTGYKKDKKCRKKSKVGVKRTNGRKTQLPTSSNLQKLKKGYMCGKCNKSFMCKSSFKWHLLTHSSEKKTVIYSGCGKYDCTICGEKCDSNRQLSKHLETEHPNNEKYRCDLCGVGFSKPSGLSSHLQSNHIDIVNKTCEVCGRRDFTNRERLYEHVLQHSSGSLFECKDCGSCYKTHYKCFNHLCKNKKVIN